jgi:hypothetical protein|tara:strand:- start:318 stop:479 length:162 start_codon:yes stop_codon:yes gene_type:complete
MDVFSENFYEHVALAQEFDDVWQHLQDAFDQNTISAIAGPCLDWLRAALTIAE